MTEWFKRSWYWLAGVFGVLLTGVLAVVLADRKKAERLVSPPEAPSLPPVKIIIDNPKPSTTYQETKAKPEGSPSSVVDNLNSRYK